MMALVLDSGTSANAEVTVTLTHHIVWVRASIMRVLTCLVRMYYMPSYTLCLLHHDIKKCVLFTSYCNHQVQSAWNSITVNECISCIVLMYSSHISVLNVSVEFLSSLQRSSQCSGLFSVGSHILCCPCQ